MGTVQTKYRLPAKEELKVHAEFLVSQSLALPPALHFFPCQKSAKADREQEMQFSRSCSSRCTRSLGVGDRGMISGYRRRGLADGKHGYLGSSPFDKDRARVVSALCSTPALRSCQYY